MTGKGVVEAKSDLEIAKALGKKAHTTGGRKIVEICKHFGTDVWGDGDQRKQLAYLFRKYCSDFEVHSSIYPDWVDGNSGDRPQTPTNPLNIPTPDRTQELTSLEFIGRDRHLTDLVNLRNQYKIVLIKDEPGGGKSLLAKEFLKRHFQEPNIIEINLALTVEDNVPASERLPIILKQLNQKISTSFALDLDCLKQRLSDRHQPPVAFLIDNLEPALDSNCRFLEKLNNYEALLSVLGNRDVFSFTLITSRRSLITPRTKVHEYLLDGLDITAWQQYFHDCKNGADSESLRKMCVAYNGNAKIMDILHGAIKTPRFDGDIKYYWGLYKNNLLANKEIETLINEEINYLRDNEPDVYKLFYQIALPISQSENLISFNELLQLLNDIPESKKASVIDSLFRTSLIEVKDKKNYYLPPVLHEAATKCLSENSIFDKHLVASSKSNIFTDTYKSCEIAPVNSQLQMEIQDNFNHFLQVHPDKNIMQENHLIKSSEPVSVFTQSSLLFTSVFPMSEDYKTNSSNIEIQQILGVYLPTNNTINSLGNVLRMPDNIVDNTTINSQSPSIFSQNYFG